MNVLRQSGPEAVVEEVLAAEQGRLDAMRRHDVDAVEGFLSGDLDYVFSSGKMEGKDDVVTAMRSGALRYGEDLDERDLIVRAFSDTAVLLGILEIHIKNDSGDFHGLNRFTSHWVHENGSWTMSSWQSTSLPAD